LTVPDSEEEDSGEETACAETKGGLDQLETTLECVEEPWVEEGDYYNEVASAGSETGGNVYADEEKEKDFG